MLARLASGFALGHALGASPPPPGEMGWLRHCPQLDISKKSHHGMDDEDDDDLPMIWDIGSNEELVEIKTPLTVKTLAQKKQNEFGLPAGIYKNNMILCKYYNHSLKETSATSDFKNKIKKVTTINMDLINYIYNPRLRV
jgi:hypothetical protein